MRCPNCDGRGAVQIAPNVKGLKRCPVCGGRGKTTEYDGLRKFWCDYKCEMCNGTGDVDMTNEEWLQTATTEQLAEWISSVVQKAISIKENNDIVMLESAIWWVEWLKQPHTFE